MGCWTGVINQPLAESGPEDSNPVVNLPDAATIAELARRLSWRYPHTTATAEPAKTTVSDIRRRVAEETDAEAVPLFPAAASSASSSFVLRPRSLSPKETGIKSRTRDEDEGRGRKGGAAGEELAPASRIETPSYQVVPMRAADIGSAHHTFLQHVDLVQTSHRSGLEAEARRLVTARILAEPEFEALDFDALTAFWNSDIGRRIRAEPARVQRELAFTASLSANDLEGLGLIAATGLSRDEFVVVQGIADLVVIQPEEIWLLDYKTDQVEPDRLNERIKAYTPQLAVYALALSRIYRRPVTRRWLHFLKLKRTEEALQELL
jgi:ATP-dependent helicase/nuclease subunit A